MNPLNTRNRLTLAFCLFSLTALVHSGCKDELSGVDPKLPSPEMGQPLPVAPGLVCQMQHPDDGTPVVITGTGFAPTPFDIPDDPKAALPDVTLIQSQKLDGSEGDLSTILFGGEPDASNADLLSWQSSAQMTFLFKNDLALADGNGMVPTGLYDVQVTNPGTSDTTSLGAFGVIDRPRLENVSPGVTCLAEEPRELILKGQTVLRFADDRAVVQINGDTFEVDALEDCTTIAHAGLDAEYCQTVKVTLGQGSVEPGFPDLLVQNPETAGCISVPAEDNVNLRVVPPPTISAAIPSLACTADGSRVAVIQGTGILVIDGQLPTVTMVNAESAVVTLEVSVPTETQAGDTNCEALETQGHEVQVCAEVEVVVPEENPAAPYKPTLTLTNPAPAGCSGSAETSLMIVPDPTISNVVPPVACTEDQEQTVTVEGTGFIGVDDGNGEQLPTVTLDGDSYEVTGLENCETLDVERLTVRRCEAATVRLPEGSLPVDPGTFIQPEVVLTNPDPAGCSVSNNTALTLVPAPVIEAATPSLICNAEGAREVVLTGSGFLEVDGALPSLTVGGDEATVTGLEDCNDLPVQGATVRQCATANVTVPVNAGAPGDSELSLTNPTGCVGTNSTALVITPPPVLTSAVPSLACSADGTRQVILTGEGFLDVDGVVPTVLMLNSESVEVSLEVSIPELTQTGEANCTAIDVEGLEVKTCTEVEVVVPEEDPAAPYKPTLTLTNPAPAGCSDSAETSLMIVPDPTISNVVPPVACTGDQEQTVTVEGTGFIGVDDGNGEQLPTVTLDGDSYEVTGLENCETLDVERLTVRRCAAATVRLPEGSLPVDPGTFIQPEVVLTNPDPAGCSVSNNVALTLVPAPVIEASTPSLICNAEGAREVVLTGSGFLEVDGTLPSLTVGGDEATVTGLEDCNDLPVQGATVRQCATANVTVPANAGTPDNSELSLTNPTGCVSGSTTALVIAPQPSISSATPSLVCSAEGARQLTLTGEGFLNVDDTLPTATLDGDSVTVVGVAQCTDLTVDGRTVQTCTELTIEVPQETGLADFATPVLSITNPDPAGCQGSTDMTLVLAPPPEITAAEPGSICISDTAQTIEIVGNRFIFTESDAPAVSLGTFDVDPASIAQPDTGCDAIAGTSSVSCDRILITLDNVTLPEGQIDVSVTNPASVGCGDTATGLFRVSARAQVITAVVPSLICTDDGDRVVTIEGDGFLRVDGQDPTVALNGTTVTFNSMDGCSPVTDSQFTIESCTSIEITVPQGTITDAGEVEVTVTNPEPIGCAVSNRAVLSTPPTVTLTSATPASVCEATSGPVDITVAGQGLLTVDGVPFTVTVGGVSAVPTDLTGCEALTNTAPIIESCTGFTVSVDTFPFPVGGAEVVVTNADPSGCGTSSASILIIDPRPVVDEIIPERVCTDEPLTLTINGRQFAADATVMIGMNAPDTTEVNDDGTSIVVTYANGIDAGTYDVTVSNGQDGLGAECSDTLIAGLEVDPLPLVFFVDPPVLFNGIDVETTIFTANLREDAATLELIDAQGTRIPIADFSSPVRPNRILAVIPAGLDPGDYEVSVTSVIGCESDLNGSLTVTDTLTLALSDINPNFVSPTKPTAVTVTTGTPDMDEVLFASTPRVYLNPNPAGADATATALRAVVLDGDTQLSAVIPAGLTPGQYDLVAVNPTGEVGILSQAVTVTANEPPFVTSFVPGSLDANSVQSAVIQGENFDDMASVALECVSFETGAPLGANGSVTVTSQTPETLNLSVDATGISAGSVCVVVVTNGDGASYRFSAISVKEPSQNLNDWAAGSPMQEPRRGLSLAAGRPTDTSRFLYAIGGDDGDPANAKASVESVSVDPFGQMGTWTNQRNTLATSFVDGMTVSSPRAFAGDEKVGQFIYMVGGNDGVGPTDSLLRAQILDPLAGPEIVDLDALLGEGEGLGAGLWFYRVAALFPESDPSNPGGESLAGEVLNVQLPGDVTIVLTLTWEQVPGARGYRIYRSPVADAPITELQLLAEVDGGDTTSFVDNNSLTTVPEETPFPQGSLGVWHAVPGAQLSTPREALATAVVTDPTVPGRWLLYAFGGRDSTGALSSGEVAVITASANQGQEVGPWTPVTAALGTGRSELAAFVVTNGDIETVDVNDTFLYLGPGRGSNNNVDLIEGGQVDLVTGDISGFVSLTSPNPTRVGYGALDANGFLYMMGGANRGASNGNDTSGALLAPTTADTVPVIDGWNALGGGTLLTPRIFMGTAQESAFFFVAGGATSGVDANVSETVEQTIQ